MKLWLDTCVEVPEKMKAQYKEWVSSHIHKENREQEREEATLNKSRTRENKAKSQEEYTPVDRKVKKSIKKEKKGYAEELASDAENAAGQRNLKDLYLASDMLTGNFHDTNKPLKDKDRNPLTTREEQLMRWAEYFRGC